jgi:hypothetical protein
MRCPARVLCIAVVTAGWLFPAALAHAQLPDLGGGGGGGDVNLPVDPGNLPGDLGNPSGDLGGLGGLGGIGGGGSNADPGGQLLVPNVVVVDHAAAVKAVQDHRALPLNDILANTAKTYRGKVIDVELVRTQQKLLYQVKLLDRGTVSLVYFDATNGRAAAAPR